MRLTPLVLVMTAATCAADEIPFYIGTYTSNGGSKGIYRAVLDTETGKLSEPELAAEAPGPSFLAVHPNGKFLYAVHEPTEGDVSAFLIQTDGKLKKLNTQSTQGGGPCHVSVDPAGKTLFTASYGAGSLASLPIKADGSLGPPATVFKNTGSGPDKSRQEGPHLHAIYSDAEGKHVYACDLGTDEVLVFALDGKDGSLTLAEPRSAKTPPGGGPRHLALHPSGRFAFVNNEMGNSVTAYARDAQTGQLKELQTISTLPDDAPRKGATTAEIFCHPSGKFLYVSNRGHDSIAAYSVAEGGKLTLLEIEPAGVSVPRGFGIDPTGRWLVVAGQKSNDLTALAVDPASGKLSPGPNRIEVGMPVCVVFVPAAGVAGAAVEADALEFRIAETEPAEGLSEAVVPGRGDRIYLHAEAVLTSQDVPEILAVRDSTGRPALSLKFTEEGGRKMRKATSDNVQKRLAILIHGRVLSAPMIDEPIHGEARITGVFTEEEVNRLAESIRMASAR